jgi:hypothetical protein
VLDSRARSLVCAGRFEVCAETQADFDGSIALGAASFEFGRLRTTGWAQVDGRSQVVAFRHGSVIESSIDGKHPTANSGHVRSG